MTNQSLIFTSIILCSLGGWYVVLTKYLELKAMSKDRPNEPVHTKIDPVSPDFNKMPEDINFTGKHVPGMGPAPHPSLPFTIPADLLASMANMRSSSKPGLNTPVSPESTPPKQVTNEKRLVCNWAAILHLSGFAIVFGIPFLNIIVPTILWLLKKEQHPFLAKQGKDIINFQITFTIMQLLCLGAGTIFIWLMPHAAESLFAWTKTIRVVFTTSLHLPYNIFTAVPFFWGCIMMVRGAVAAYSGLSFKYPYAQPFVFIAEEQTRSAESPVPSKKVQKAPVAPTFSNISFS